jgi:D-glycero-D-manno-heptose 1,7-bisphosphate phosphatase
MILNKAVFLDRDGVLNFDTGYVSCADNFILIPGVVEGLTILQSLDFKLVVVTNQSGIARGMFSELDFMALTNHMTELFRRKGISLDGVYFCPHHPDITGICECRKPNPGLVLEAAEALNLDLGCSYMIGDKQSDVTAGISAGVKISALISPDNINPDENRFKSLFDFAVWLKKRSH